MNQIDGCKAKKSINVNINRLFLALVEVTGLEPAASWSQTKHSTKLSYTSLTKITTQLLYYVLAPFVKRFCSYFWIWYSISYSWILVWKCNYSIIDKIWFLSVNPETLLVISPFLNIKIVGTLTMLNLFTKFVSTSMLTL